MNLSGEFIRLVLLNTKLLILRIDSGEPVKIEQPADRKVVTADISLNNGQGLGIGSVNPKS